RNLLVRVRQLDRRAPAPTGLPAGDYRADHLEAVSDCRRAAAQFAPQLRAAATGLEHPAARLGNRAAAVPGAIAAAPARARCGGHPDRLNSATDLLPHEALFFARPVD